MLASLCHRYRFFLFIRFYIATLAGARSNSNHTTTPSHHHIFATFASTSIFLLSWFHHSLSAINVIDLFYRVHSSISSSCNLNLHVASLLESHNRCWRILKVWSNVSQELQDSCPQKMRLLSKFISKRLPLKYLPQYWSDGKVGCWQTCLSCCTCQMGAVHIRFFHGYHEMQPGYRRNMTVC